MIHRNDDRLILMTCQKEGASATTFEKIAQQLKSRTKSEVRYPLLSLSESPRRRELAREDILTAFLFGGFCVAPCWRGATVSRH